MNDKLTDIKHWEKQQGLPSLELESNNIIRAWLEESIDFGSLKDCIEIGCYPGRYLTIFGDHGIEVSGVDYIQRVLDLPELYKKKGYSVGNFYHLDFTKENINKKFDCVFSLGFIEHFQNWEGMLLKHAGLVKENGLLIIEAPNYRGWMQRLPRYIFDNKNYKRHNIKSINLDAWIKILTSNGFEVINAQAFGGYQIWFDRNGGAIEKKTRNMFVRALKIIKKIVYPKKENDVAFSAAIGIVAKR